MKGLLPAALQGASLACALCYQNTFLLLAGVWFPLHLWACAISLYSEGQKERGALWWLVLFWLVALTCAAFFISPVLNGAMFFWNLSAAPIIALSMRGENFPTYFKAIGFVLVLYAVGLILQMVLNVHYTSPNLAYNSYFDHALGFPYASAWPLIDPNNAAVVINCGLIPAFWMGMKDKRWLTLAAIFAFALFATASKAGLSCGLGACFFMVYLYKMPPVMKFMAGIVSIGVLGCFPSLIFSLLRQSFENRVPIWQAASKLTMIAPWRGLGLGTFGHYYNAVRTEHYTTGAFAHNDILQLIIETGWPIALIFVVLIIGVAFSTWRGNIVSGLTMLAVFLQSLVEFQFYLPSISILMGIALAWHMQHAKKREAL